MSENIDRAAIIIYTSNPSDPNDILIMLGITKYGINTIGGGKEHGENDITCCIRECYEETHGLIDFRSAKVILRQAKNFKYDKCVYYMVLGDFNTLMSIIEQFPHVKIDKDPDSCTNELSDLCLVSINKLVKQFVMQDYGEKIKYFSAFINMFMDVGYDKIKGNTWNHYATSINMPSKLNVPLSELPHIISVSLIPDKLPIKYGELYEDTTDNDQMNSFSTHKKLYISEQYYYSNGNEHVYRKTIINNDEIVYKR